MSFLNKLMTLLFLLFLSNTYAELPLNYQTLDASEKREIQWLHILDSQYSEDDYPKASFLLSARNLINPIFLSKTFDTFSDEMPYRLNFWDEKVYRTKTIHQVGTVAKIQFVPVKMDYTGIFKRKALGLARISTAIPYSFNPGMGIKFYIDGVASVNVAVMKSLTSDSKDCNPFFANFSNIIPKPMGPLWIAASAFRFEANKRGGTENELSVAHFARVHTLNPVAPRQIILKPSHYTKSFSYNCELDYRKTLKLFQAGEKLYDVYAKKTLESSEELIGSIMLESEFIASKYGDEVLFFQHHIE